MAKIKVELNTARSELEIPGYRTSRLSSTMTFGAFVPNPAVGGVKYVRTVMPSWLWQEPNTGVIMLKPYPLTAEYYDTGVSDAARGIISLAEWNRQAALAVQEVEQTKRKYILVGRSVSGADLIDTSINAAISAILSDAGSKMVSVFTSKTNLAINQGWSLWAYPTGDYADRSEQYMGISFGERYFMFLHTDGTAHLHANTGTVSSPAWKEVAVFQYTNGSVEHGRPFQLTCIPFGFSYLAFTFTQAADPKKASRGSLSVGEKDVFLYDINSGEEVTTPWDATINHWVKYPAAQVRIMLKKKYYTHTFQFARTTYPTESQTCYITPEIFPQVYNGVNPTLSTYGFTPAGSGFSSTFVNHKNTAWNSAVDTKLVPAITFQASSGGLYTPELWSYDVVRTPKVTTPDWSVEDVSDKWSKLQFTLGTESMSHPAQITLTRRDENYANLLKPQSPPVRISIKNNADSWVNVFDGYVTHKYSTMDYRYVRERYECRDMWQRLKDTYLDNFDFLDGKSLRAIIVALIKSAGFLDSDISITDPDGDMTSLNFSGFKDPNDLKSIDPGKSVAEIINFIQDYFWNRPLRVLWKTGQWKVYFGPIFDGTTPTIRFTSHLTNAELAQSDSERRTNNVYKITGDLEFTVRPLEFNRLIVRTTTGVGSGAEGIQAVIAPGYGNSWFHDTIYDPTSPWFTGRIKTKVVVPPGAVLAQSKNELEIYGRTYWDRYSRVPTELQVLGEYMPEIQPDQFVWVTGLNTSSEKVCYGAYRIDNINVEITMDHATDSRWNMQARYTLMFVGVVDEEDYPMFTDNDNLPLRNP